MSRHPDPHSRPTFWDICTFLLEFGNVSSQAEYVLENDVANETYTETFEEIYDDICNIAVYEAI